MRALHCTLQAFYVDCAVGVTGLAVWTIRFSLLVKAFLPQEQVTVSNRAPHGVTKSGRLTSIGFLNKKLTRSIETYRRSVVDGTTLVSCTHRGFE
jgi:hypothetical protein